MPEQPKSRSDANWSISGVKFGRADRDKSNKVLASIVESMQREVRLTEDSSPEHRMGGAQPRSSQ